MGPTRYFSERERQRGRRVLNIGFKDSASVLDYNAHRVGLPVDKPFVCNNRAFASLEAMAEVTGRERHVIDIRNYEEVFATAEEPEHAPSNEGRLYQADQVDLRLRPDSPVVDAGCRLPGINEHFMSDAPDLAAYELGQPLPHYGPRGKGK